MQKVLRLVLVLSLPLFLTSFHIPEKEKLKWLAHTELQSAFAKQPRPIIIDVYTDWCGWCKVMDRETYSNEKVIGYLNKNFYAVKFNAESKAEVVLQIKSMHTTRLTMPMNWLFTCWEAAWVTLPQFSCRH